MAPRGWSAQAWILFVVAYVVIHVALDIGAFSLLTARYPDGSAPFPLEIVVVVDVVLAAVLANVIVRATRRRAVWPSDAEA